MKEKIAQLKESNPIKIIQQVLSSKYFTFVTAAFVLLSYYRGLDVVLFYYYAFAYILIALLLDDMTPVFSILIFLGVSISIKNTPAVFMGTTDYYHRPEIFIQIFIIVALMIAAMIYRLIKSIIDKKFKLTPVFYGTCGFAFVLIVNGIFSAGYNPKNLLYGFILAAAILGIYSALKDNIHTTSDSFEKIAFAFLSLSVLLIIELIVAYATTKGLFENGTIMRDKLVFGWGVYNTFGVMLLICIPAVMYLAGKKKFGFFYTLYSLVLFVALFFSCSRQAMIGGAAIYPFCIAMTLIKKQNRLENIIVLSAAAAVSIVLIGVFHESVTQFFRVIFNNLVVDGELSGSGRTQIWREAIAYFKKYPVFGSGFFVYFSYAGSSGLGFIPLMCHNTVLQLLSSCGIIGLIAYVIHRTLTVISFCKNHTVDRAFIGLTILCILALSLLDNHLFNIFPTIIYGALLAVFDKSEKKSDNENTIKATSKAENDVKVEDDIKEEGNTKDAAE